MLRFILLGACILVTNMVFSQSRKHSFGLTTNYNWAAFIYKNPQNPQDGRSQTQALKGVGIGLYHRFMIYNSLDIESSLSYQRKGYRQENQIQDWTGGSVSNFEFNNVFNFIDFYSLIQYKIIKGKKIIPKIFYGLGVGYLSSYKLWIDNWALNDMPPDSYFINTKPHNFSFFYVAGVQIDIRDKFSLGFEHKHDIGNFIKSEDIKAKNWLWDIKLSYNLKDILD